MLRFPLVDNAGRDKPLYRYGYSEYDGPVECSAGPLAPGEGSSRERKRCAAVGIALTGRGGTGQLGWTLGGRAAGLAAPATTLGRDNLDPRRADLDSLRWRRAPLGSWDASGDLHAHNCRCFRKLDGERDRGAHRSVEASQVQTAEHLELNSAKMQYLCEAADRGTRTPGQVRVPDVLVSHQLSDNFLVQILSVRLRL